MKKVNARKRYQRIVIITIQNRVRQRTIRLAHRHCRFLMQKWIIYIHGYVCDTLKNFFPHDWPKLRAESPSCLAYSQRNKHVPTRRDNPDDDRRKEKLSKYLQLRMTHKYVKDLMKAGESDRWD